MSAISEQGLYFFLGRSDKPAALPFQKWLAGEVLPSIRKTGSYAVPGAEKFTLAGMELDLPKDYSESLRILATVAERAKEMAPKAAFYDRLRASMQEPLLGDEARVLAARGWSERTRPTTHSAGTWLMTLWCHR
jgi:prophage antirepressor-like protein